MKTTVDTTGAKVLFADDSEDTIELFLFWAKEFTWDVEVARNSQQIVDLVNRNCLELGRCYDLIVSDLNFGGEEYSVSGIAVAREIRKISECVPIVFYTGYTGSMIREEVRRVGNSTIMPKDGNIDELFQHLAERIGQYWLEHSPPMGQCVPEGTQISIPESLEELVKK